MRLTDRRSAPGNRCANLSRQRVFYFGEAVDIYEDGEIVRHDGAWLAGVNGAQPGIIMPGRYLLGSRYFQEIALEPGHESLKRYCPGIGLVQDNEALLEEFDLSRDDDDD